MNHSLHAAQLCTAAVLITLLISQHAIAAGEQPAGNLSPEAIQKIDDAAAEVLKKTAVPSTSIAVVRDGRIVYLHAYGSAQLEPRVPADPALRYGIGSISKQLTASALLLLQQDGKLSLDDMVAKYLPELTRAGEITIRQLLSHTSGYQDYWTQDYMFPLMVQPIKAEGIMDRWALQPLDYEPGAKWQYSNTGYVIAGRIVEKARSSRWARGATWVRYFDWMQAD